MKFQTGAENLLLNCGEARAGERLLIAYEPPEYGYYDADAVPCVAKAAQILGLDVKTIDVGFSPDNPHLTPELAKEFERADIILFLARLGDQLRFSDMPEDKRIIVSFALGAEMFDSRFGKTNHLAMMELKNLVTKSFEQAETVRVTCPAGSDFSGKPQMPTGKGSDTTIRRFPMSVFQPVPASSFSGKVALCGFLTGTGSLYYDDYTVETKKPLKAVLKDGRLVGFEGCAHDVAAADAHYDRVSETFGIDRDYVHSWHAGIHPGCGYLQKAQDNYERWGGSSFGNPRILHFHTCGAYAPGEISWNVVDPTIEIDGVKVWQNGRFHAELLPGGQAVLDSYPCAAKAFSDPTPEIGLTIPA